MKFIEKNLEDIIFESNRLELIKRGLDVRGKMLRQLKIGNYGTADLVTIQKPYFYPKTEWTNPHHNSSFLVTIYELKKEKIGILAFLQAIRYAKGIKSWFEKSKYYGDYSVDLKIVLIGNEIEKDSVFSYIPDIFETQGERSVELFLYQYKIDGIHFENNSSWVLTNEGF